jgi:hypothetical protein
LLTRITAISLHMQWPLTSQPHGSVSQREQGVQHISHSAKVSTLCTYLLR